MATIEHSRCCSTATSRACSPSAATCSAPPRTPRTCSKTSSPPRTPRSSPTSATSPRGLGSTASRATAASTSYGARWPRGRTRWTCTRTRTAPRHSSACSDARSCGRSWRTSRSFPRPSAPRSSCARSTTSRTRRSPRRWAQPCRRSSRSWCGRACPSPRPARRASSPARKCGSSWPKPPRGFPRSPPRPAGMSAPARGAVATAANSAPPPRRSRGSHRSVSWRSCAS